MPTLRSIGVHPDLRKRLAVASISTPTGDEEQQLNLIPIATPHALLFHPPGALRLAEDETLSNSKSIATHQAESLRHDVAIAMIFKSNTGRHWKRIAMAAQEDNLLGDDQSLGPQHDADSMFPTVLDLIRYKDQESLERIELRIGCPSLDRAIALPSELTSSSFLPTAFASNKPQLGIPFGFITQFTGHPGVGKTRLACHLGVSCARQGGLTWWIYTGAPPHLPVQDADNVLERIFVVPAMDGFGLLARLAEFENLLQKIKSPALLIVDSCSVCLGAVENESLYSTVLLEIKRLTREYGFATVLMNGTVADRQSGGRKPALGHYWSGAADISVWLEAQPIDQGCVKAIVERHFAREASNAEHRFHLIPE